MASMRYLTPNFGPECYIQDVGMILKLHERSLSMDFKNSLRLFTIRVVSKIIRIFASVVYSLQNAEKNELNAVSEESKKPVAKLSSRGILITTFEKRQFEAALPLVKAIRREKIEYPIAVFINGNLESDQDPIARQKFIRELSNFEGVSIVCSNVMTGISRNWNLGIQLLGTDSILCLSDDVLIHADAKRDLENAFNIAEVELFLTIGSFASFIVTRRCIREIGWFDERFIGFGEEDGDYIWRFLAHFKRKPRNYYTSSLEHLDMQSKGSEISFGGSKYSLTNIVFRKIKYSEKKTGIQGTFDVPHELNLEENDLHPLETFRERTNETFRLEDEKQIELIMQNALKAY